MPTGPVYVCLKRAGGETVVNGRILQAGSRQPTYRSKRFRLLLGNSEVRLRVNGRTRAVAPTGGILGYEITPPGRVQPAAGREPPGLRRMSARAGIVVTGTEVLSGRVSDRNGPWLSDRLRELGVDHAYTRRRRRPAPRTWSARSRSWPRSAST